ncbi:MAG: hypothetical protein PF569_02780 [Candidatus Woesearchaeota archaeon]|jgi:hypothetical protein|nr:hypothetical protein [Candidatus Woesearchaeota archaeon]
MELDFVEIVLSKEINKKPRDTIFYQNLKNLREIVELSEDISSSLLAFRSRGYDKAQFENEIRLEYALRLQPLVEAILTEFQSNYDFYSNFEISTDTFKETLDILIESTIEKEKKIIEYQISKRAKKHFETIRYQAGEEIAQKELQKDVIRGQILLKSLKNKIIDNIYDTYIVCYQKKKISVYES